MQKYFLCLIFIISSWSCQKEKVNFTNQNLLVNIVGVHDLGINMLSNTNSSPSKSFNNSYSYSENELLISGKSTNTFLSKYMSVNNLNSQKYLDNNTEVVIVIFNDLGHYVTHRSFLYTVNSISPSFDLEFGEYNLVVLASKTFDFSQINFVNNFNNIELNSVKASDDLMYKIQKVSVVQGSNPSVSIILNHIFTKLNIQLTSDIGNITSINSLGFKASNATVNLRLNNLNSDYNISNDESIVISSNPILNNSNTLTTELIIFTTTNNTTIIFEDIEIDNVKKSFNFNIPAINSGFLYNIHITLNSSNTSRPIDIGGDFLWSPGNLQFSNGIYGFVNSQGDLGTPLKLKYGTNNLQYIQNGTVMNDPCMLVAELGGNWKMPTKSEFEYYTGTTHNYFLSKNFNIVTSPQNRKALHGTNKVRGVYLGINNQPTPIANENNYLFLPLGSHQSTGYWTSTRDPNNDNHFFFQFGADYQTIPLNSDYFNKEKFIRCVKRKN